VIEHNPRIEQRPSDARSVGDARVDRDDRHGGAELPALQGDATLQYPPDQVSQAVVIATGISADGRKSARLRDR